MRAQLAAMVQHRPPLGLWHDGPGQGHFYVDHKTGELVQSRSAYEHPQPHACFIQSIEDDLVNDNGIMDLWVREARLFKYGSGTGSNFSKLRGENEPLSGGGKSSGLMSFLKIGDRAAGAIKSGGTTRRAAKMVVVDIDHPDIEAYIGWKVKEEEKVASLVAGSLMVKKHVTAIMKACINCEGPGPTVSRSTEDPALKRAVREARRNHVADGMIKRHATARQGHKELPIDIYDTDWDGEAIARCRAELQQFGCGSPMPSSPPSRAAGASTSNGAPGRAWRARFRPASCGRRSAMRPGLRRPRHPVPHHDQ